MAAKHVIEPAAGDSRKVIIRYAPLDGVKIELMAWEALFHLNWAGNGWYCDDGQITPWTKTDNGRLFRQMQNVDGVKASAELKPTDEAVFITLTVSNITEEVNHEFWGVHDFKDFWAVICVGFREEPFFWDPHFERVFISVDGKETAVKDTDLSTTFKQCLPAYWVKGQKPRLQKLVEGAYNYGCGVSSTEADESWIAVESTDRKYTLLAGFPRVHHLWTNRRPPAHGCMHPQAMVGDIAPGQTVSTTGAVMIVDTPAAGAAERWRDVMRGS